MKTRTCYKCKRELPLTRKYFYTSRRNVSGLQYICIECEKERVKEYRIKNKDKIKVDQREYHLKKCGLSVEEYNKLFDEQKGRCKICGRHQNEFKNRLHIDHDHETGKIRSLLCGNCNRTLGYFGENPLIFIKMAKYVIKSGRRF